MHDVAVVASECGEGFGGGRECAGDVPVVVLAVEADAFARIAIGTDSHDVIEDLSVGVDD